jgi:hypothetical protein
VGDAAGELADDLHALHLQQLLLELLLFLLGFELRGDVAEVGDDALHRRVVEEVLPGPLDGPPGAVAAPEPAARQRPRPGGSADPQERFAGVREVVGMDEAEEVAADELARPETELARQVRALVADQALGVAHQDGARVVLDQRPEVALAPVEGFLGVLAAGDVVGDDDRRSRPAGAVADRGDGDREGVAIVVEDIETHLGPGQGLAVVGFEAGAELGPEGFPERTADDVVEVVSGAQHAAAGQLIAEVAVEDHHRSGEIVDQPPVALLAGLQTLRAASLEPLDLALQPAHGELEPGVLGL